jgi:hypothetical protein
MSSPKFSILSGSGCSDDSTKISLTVLLELVPRLDLYQNQKWWPVLIDQLTPKTAKEDDQSNV